jgi:hypothetical protein
LHSFPGLSFPAILYWRSCPSSLGFTVKVIVSSLAKFY